MNDKNTKDQYVCGFLFTMELDEVLLLRKKHGPSKLIGHLNGIGGRVDAGEDIHRAMHREFKEETSFDFRAFRHYCTLRWAGVTAPSSQAPSQPTHSTTYLRPTTWESLSSY